MNHEERIKMIDDYFENTTKEQILKDLEDCGLNRISRPEDYGYKLKEPKFYRIRKFLRLIFNRR